MTANKYSYEISPILFFLFCLLLGSSCEEEEAIVGFESVSGIAKEGDGTQTITINLGKKATSAIIISYVVGGTASLDGDYKILSNSSYYYTSSLALTVQEGESTASLSFLPINDTQIEPRNESIYFEITGTSDSELTSSLNHAQYTFQIEDNDTPPSDGLQIDLSWYLGEGVSINKVNLDLYLAGKVEINEDGEITNLELVDHLVSTNTKGFENFIIDEEISDGDYYIVIRFLEGTLNADVFLHLVQSPNRNGFASGTLTTDYVGKDVYYGPISKSGNNFLFR